MTEKEQDWASRSSHHQTFTARLAKEFIALKDCPNLASSKELQEQGQEKVFLKVWMSVGVEILGRERLKGFEIEGKVGLGVDIKVWCIFSTWI